MFFQRCRILDPAQVACLLEGLVVVQLAMAAGISGIHRVVTLNRWHHPRTKEPSQQGGNEDTHLTAAQIGEGNSIATASLEIRMLLRRFLLANLGYRTKEIAVPIE